MRAKETTFITPVQLENLNRFTAHPLRENLILLLRSLICTNTLRGKDLFYFYIGLISNKSNDLTNLNHALVHLIHFIRLFIFNELQHTQDREFVLSFIRVKYTFFSSLFLSILILKNVFNVFKSLYFG